MLLSLPDSRMALWKVKMTKLSLFLAGKIVGCEFSSAADSATSQLDDSDKVTALCHCFPSYKKRLIDSLL